MEEWIVSLVGAMNWKETEIVKTSSAMVLLHHRPDCLRISSDGTVSVRLDELMNHQSIIAIGDTTDSLTTDWSPRWLVAIACLLDYYSHFQSGSKGLRKYLRCLRDSTWLCLFSVDVTFFFIPRFHPPITTSTSRTNINTNQLSEPRRATYIIQRH
jgi:hypothetical protein